MRPSRTRSFHVAAELFEQGGGFELHVIQHFAHGIAVDHRVEHHIALFIELNVHGIGVAEQVVQVAQDLLIRAHQKRARIVRLAVERVQRQGFLHVAAIDELVDFAVGIAGNIAENAMVRRLFVQPMNRHDGEQLLHRPTVRHALEQRKIAEIGVGEQCVQAFQLFREIIQILAPASEFAGRSPSR